MWRYSKMSRLEKLNEATSRMLGADDDALSVVLLVLGCITHDVMLDKICQLPYPIFAELVRARDAAINRGDAKALNAIKSDARAAMEHITTRALDVIFARQGRTTVRAPRGGSLMSALQP